MSRHLARIGAYLVTFLLAAVWIVGALDTLTRPLLDLGRPEIGDIIIAANGQPVTRLADLQRTLQQAGVGATVTLTVERKMRRRQVELRVADIGAQGP